MSNKEETSKRRNKVRYLRKNLNTTNAHHRKSVIVFEGILNYTRYTVFTRIVAPTQITANSRLLRGLKLIIATNAKYTYI